MTSSMNLLSFSTSALLRSEYSKSIRALPSVLRRTLAENRGDVNGHSAGQPSRNAALNVPACGTGRKRDYSAASAVRLRRSAARSGRSTASAMTAAMAFMTAATRNTACQSPVATISTLPSGTSSEAVPLAV